MTTIGFNCLLRDSVNVLGSKDVVLVACGDTLIVSNLTTKEQRFMRGHRNKISTFTVSKCGRFAASADTAQTGFLSEVILWDIATLTASQSYKMHKGSVKCLSFSNGGTYLASAGGVDDRNRILIWDLTAHKAVYAHSFGGNEVCELVFFNKAEDRLVATLGTQIQILTLNSKDKRIDSFACNIGNLKRQFSSVTIDKEDRCIYAGTKTGDVIELLVEKGIMKKVGPAGKLFESGVRRVELLTSNDRQTHLIVGTGSGSLCCVDRETMKRTAECQLEGGVTALSLVEADNTAVCATDKGNIYTVDVGKTAKMEAVLKESVHVGKVNQVCFPRDFSEVFATCCNEQIKVWALKRRQELLRIVVPGVECHCICFSFDGKAIISGWNDGKIRAFFPQSGKLMWIIEDAHANGVTALTITPDGETLLSGGHEGEIRIWRVAKDKRSLVESMKEHRGMVAAMHLNSNGELVSCSADGSCIIWDLKNKARILCIFEKTIFKRSCFCPDGSQLLTVGSDCRIAYWSAFDGELIRYLQASDREGEVNALDISKEGNFIVTGGQDPLLRVWAYHEGKCVEKLQGNFGAISDARIAPDCSHVVSAGVEGDLVIYRLGKAVTAIK